MVRKLEMEFLQCSIHCTKVCVVVQISHYNEPNFYSQGDQGLAGFPGTPGEKGEKGSAGIDLIFPAIGCLVYLQSFNLPSVPPLKLPSERLNPVAVEGKACSECVSARGHPHRSLVLPTSITTHHHSHKLGHTLCVFP